MAPDEVHAHLLLKKCGKPGDLHLLSKPRWPPHYLSELVEELTSGAAQELSEYDCVYVAGYTLHSTQYRLPSKRDSMAVRLGNEYVRAEHILSAKDHEGSQSVFTVSYVYDMSDFGNASGLPQRKPIRRYTSSVVMQARVCL